MRLPGKNILVVDDDASLRHLLRKILTTAGCHVEEAEDVRSALEKIQSKLPDLIILDLSMPEHDGFALLGFRNQNRFIKSIPVLVLSSSTHRTTVERALAMGANQFLEKPLKANLVLQKLRRLFYSQELFSHPFSEGEYPTVSAKCNADIVAQSNTQLKIASTIKFEHSKPIHIHFDSYISNGGSELIGKVDHHRIETDEGIYLQTVTITGMSKEEKEKLKQWQKQL